MNKITVKLEDIKAQTQKALVNHGASKSTAESVAEAVKVAEAENNKVCGLYYLESYCNQLKSNRVDGSVSPEVKKKN